MIKIQMPVNSMNKSNYLVFLSLLFILFEFNCLTGSSQSEIDSIRPAFNSIKNKNIALLSIHNSVAHYIRVRDFEVTEFLLNKGIDYSIDINSDTSLAYMYLYTGVLKYYQSDLLSAEQNYQKAIDLYTIIPKSNKTRSVKANEANAYNNIGNVYKAHGLFDQALKNNYAAIKIRQEINDSSAIAASFLNIGNVYLRLNDLDKAKEYYLKSLAYFKVLDNQFGIASTTHNLALILEDLGEYESAFKQYSIALENYKKLDRKKQIAKTLNNMANNLLILEKPDLAKLYLDSALTMYNEIKDSTGIASAEENLGIYYIQTGQYDKAEEILKDSYSLSRIRNLGKKEIETTKLLSELYALKNDYKYAYTYFLLSDSIRSEVFSEKRKMEFEKYETQFNEEKRLKTEAINKLALQTTTDKLNYNKRINRLLIIGLVIIIFFGVWLFIFYKKERNIKLQLEITNSALEKINNEYEQTLISKKEKEILLREIHHRVKNNLQIINSLLRLQAQKSPPEIQNMFLDIQTRITAMSLLHEQLYITKDFSKIDVKIYIDLLITNLKSSFLDSSSNIVFTIDIEVAFSDLDTLHPLGLLVNEIVSNSLKYAFNKTNKNKVIYLSLTHLTNQFNLKIGDNGRGIKQKDIDRNPNSVGLDLIESLALQLGGNLESDYQNGTHYTLLFSNDS